MIVNGSTDLYWWAGGCEIRRASKSGALNSYTTFAAMPSCSTGTVAIDASDVYWTYPSGGLVQRRPKADGSIVTLATGQASPYGIAVDDRFVYWANTSAGTVMCLPK